MSVNDIAINGSQINNCLAKAKIFDFFFKNKRPVTTNEDFVVQRQKKILAYFFDDVLGYINQLMTSQLDKFFGDNWKKEKIGYVISIKRSCWTI